MRVLNLIQGSQEWLNVRTKCECASDAPAVLGCSPYKTRAQLLREKHTGVPADIDIATQKRFDNGHRAEKLALPLAEEFIGAELFPAVCVSDDGTMLASMDGLTLDETTGFEHKALNAELRAIFASGTDDMEGSLLPLMHRVQMEMQFMVTGCQRTLFMCSEWTADGELVEEHHCWYYPDPALQSQIAAAWQQFRADLAAYALPEPAAEPVTAAPVETLPAVAVRMDGALVVQSNLPAFGVALKAFVARVPRQPSTDQEFADTEAACKALKRAEEALDAAEANALASLSDVEAMRRMVADFRTLARDTRLASEKMVERRKRDLKEQAVMAARKALDDHIAVLQAELAPMRLQPIAVDFAGAIKGLRSIDSMQNALDTALAAGKIAADMAARVIRGNMAHFHAHAAGFEFLFADLHQIANKAADDFNAVMQSRIATHRAAEAERERKRAAAEQERIAAEAKRMADEAIRQAEAQRLEAERLAAQQAEDARVAALAEQRRQDAAAESARIAAAAAPAAPLVATPEGDRGPNRFYREKPPEPAASRADEPATLKLGDICARLLFIVRGDFLADTLHVKPARTERGIGYYTESQYALICRQLISHVGAMAELYAPEAVS